MTRWRAETENARVFEKPAQDGMHANSIGKPCDAGSQAADAAHDEINFATGLRGSVEFLDDRRVGETVDLQDDASAGMRLRPNAVDDSVPQVFWGDQELVVVAEATSTC